MFQTKIINYVVLLQLLGNAVFATETPLAKAIQANDIESVQNLLKSGANPNEVYKHNVTALKMAVTNGNKELVELLYKYGAKLQDADDDILQYAFWRKKYALIPFLIEKGANVNSHGAYNISSCGSPLYYAVGARRADLVKLLLARGASIDSKNQWGHTALDLARNYGDKEILKALEVFGLIPQVENFIHQASTTKPNKQDLDKYFVFSVLTNRLDYVEKIFNLGADPNARDQENTKEPVLFIAAKDNLAPIVKFLLRNGAKIDPGETNYNALQVAAMSGAFEAAEVFIEFGADVNKPGFADTTALMLAAHSGNDKLVSLLLSKGALIDVKDTSNRTAIDWAVSARKLETTKLLLSKMTSVPLLTRFLATSYDFRTTRPAYRIILELIFSKISKDEINAIEHISGDTLLIRATKSQLPFAVAMLLERGAEMNLRNGRGVTALQIARELNNLEIANLLTKKGAAEPTEKEKQALELDKALYAAVARDDIDGIKKALNRGASLDYRDDASVSTLERLIVRCNPKVLAILRDEDIHLGVSPAFYTSILNLAVQVSCLEFVKRLVNSKVFADLSDKDEFLNLKTADGKTAVFLAAQNNNIEILKTLLSADVLKQLSDPEAYIRAELTLKENNTKISALDYSAQNKYTDVVKILVSPEILDHIKNPNTYLQSAIKFTEAVKIKEQK